MSNTQLNVGLIGTGRIGRVHAEHLTTRVRRARLVAIADLNESTARECAANCDSPTVFTDHRNILENQDIDAVLICSATDTHAQIIEEAAAAGKHVFCEKPIDFDLARIDRALAAVAEAGIKFQVGFNRRFDANHQRIRKAVEQGEIGEPRRVHIVSRDPAPPPEEYIKASGGLFADMTIHDFDMARFLVGHEVEEVYAVAGVMVDESFRRLHDVDTAVTILKFENGVTATIDNCRQSAFGYDQRVEVFGSGGSIQSDNQYPNATVISDANSVRRDQPLYFFMERYKESFAIELDAFVQAVVDDETPEATGKDGRTAVVMGIAAQKSRTENRPVRIAEVDRP